MEKIEFCLNEKPFRIVVSLSNGKTKTNYYDLSLSENEDKISESYLKGLRIKSPNIFYFSKLNQKGKKLLDKTKKTPKFNIGDVVLRRSNYTEDYIEILIVDIVEGMFNSFQYLSKNGVLYNGKELTKKQNK